MSDGSSPLARGLRGEGRRIGEQLGIIPARAGFTIQFRQVASQSRDHPRSRGVYQPGAPPREGSSGSSPLARGLRLEPRPQLSAGRIIPARAGFTSTRVLLPWLSRDHPRSRGVYMGAGRLAQRPVGSSPLARGLPDHAVALVALDRIIPARAGFTRRASCSAPHAADHPRSRGVYHHTTYLVTRSMGSSPLARGLH